MRTLFKYKSDDKILCGVFTGPEIKKVIKNKGEFILHLNKKEKSCFLDLIDLINKYKKSRY